MLVFSNKTLDIMVDNKSNKIIKTDNISYYVIKVVILGVKDRKRYNNRDIQF